MFGRPNYIQAIVALSVLAVCLVMIGIGYIFWCDMIKEEPVGAVLRNLSLTAGVPIAIILALWRSAIANRQASAAHKQVETAIRQTAIAQEGFLRDRFQRAAEMLSHDSIAGRIGGIQSLAELAAQNMDQYYVTVANLLEAYVTCSTNFDRSTGGSEASGDGDMQVARDAIEMLRGLRTKGVKRVEMNEMQDLVPNSPGSPV